MYTEYTISINLIILLTVVHYNHLRVLYHQQYVQNNKRGFFTQRSLECLGRRGWRGKRENDWQNPKTMAAGV